METYVREHLASLPPRLVWTTIVMTPSAGCSPGARSWPPAPPIPPAPGTCSPPPCRVLPPAPPPASPAHPPPSPPSSAPPSQTSTSAWPPPGCNTLYSTRPRYGGPPASSGDLGLSYHSPLAGHLQSAVRRPSAGSSPRPGNLPPAPNGPTGQQEVHGAGALLLPASPAETVAAGGERPLLPPPGDGAARHLPAHHLSHHPALLPLAQQEEEISPKESSHTAAWFKDITYCVLLDI